MPDPVATPAPAEPVAVATPAADPVVNLATDPPAAPAGTDPPAATPLATDGSLGENWFLGLGDEFAAHAPTLGRFKSLGDLANSYVHLRTTGPAYPGEGSTPDDITRFRALAQVPEDAAGYGLAKPDDLPAGVQWDDETATAYAEIAHTHHVPKPALEALAAKQIEIETERAAGAQRQMETNLEERRQALLTHWGQDTDVNASNVRHLVTQLAQAEGIAPDSAEWNEIVDAAKFPGVARLLHRAFQATTEDSLRIPNSGPTGSSPAQQLDDIYEGRDPVWSKKWEDGAEDACRHVADLAAKIKTD